MLVKSICVMTLFCLMELFSASCESYHLVFAPAGTDATETALLTNGEPEYAGVAVYPSPLQFAN